MQPTKKLHPAIIAVIVIVLVGVVVATVVAIDATNKPTNEAPNFQQTQSGTSTNTTDGTYTNGTYTQTGYYSTPGGRESISLTVTIENDIITSATLDQHATAGDSREYQGRFASGYKSLVEGKDIDTVSLSRVAGSSLTSNGFNDALDLIKADAQT